MSKKKLMAEVEIGDEGQVFVDTDTIVRVDGPETGYDDDYDDDAIEGDYYDDDDAIEGDYDDESIEGEDPEVGRRRRRRGNGGRNSGRRGGRRGGRRSGRRGSSKGGKSDTSGWVETAVGGETTIDEAGLVTVKITPQHDFVSKSVSFLGTTAGTSVRTAKFADDTVLDVDGGLDVNHYNETGKNKENFNGHFLKGGLTATFTFQTSADSGVVKVAIFGKKPNS